jgi:hypothetical protein
MTSTYIPIIFLLVISFSIIGTFYIITFIQHRNAKDLLMKLSSENLIHARVRFYQLHKFFLTTKGGFPIKAELYYNENLILLCPKRGSWFNSLFNLNLPVLFMANQDKLLKLNRYQAAVKPDGIKFTKWNDLIIDYQGYNITIEFLLKSDKEQIKIIKDSFQIKD